MRISNIVITNFRNYSKLKLDFADSINIFVGKNGEGKTNLLESILVLAITKSHRSYIDKNLIKEGSEFSKITGEVLQNDKKSKFEILISSKGKRVSINNIPLKKISDYVSNFTAILFCPDDLELIKGSPSERRKFLNIEIGQLDNKYLIYLNDYNNLIKNRNEYLKNIHMDSYNKEYLEVINNQIVDKAIVIYKYRFEFLESINNKTQEIYKLVSGNTFNIKYLNSCEINEYNEEKIRNILFDKLNNNLRKEIFQGNTLYGPHKDDFEIYIDEKNVKDYGSQGQQRLSVLSMKLSELEIFNNNKGDYPVLLLDDVFSELDIDKRNKLVSFINPKVQVFITSTDVKNIDETILNNSKIINIEDVNKS